VDLGVALEALEAVEAKEALAAVEADHASVPAALVVGAEGAAVLPTVRVFGT
jgi:hypothetical protein